MMSSMATEAPSSFSSLPDDILLSVLARVPRQYYPILSCVSKKLLCLVRSSELHKTRSLMGKDCFYVCFEEKSSGVSSTRHLFTLTENRRLVPTSFPSPPEPYYTALMVGHEIYFIGQTYNYLSRSMSMWILDSRSGKLRQGPSLLFANFSPAVGLVDEKIYIFGDGYEDIKAQVFDLKTQTWQIAPNPNIKRQYSWRSLVSPSLRKIYARIAYGRVAIVYDPRDGNCEIINLPTHRSSENKDVCVIDNVLYYYDHTRLELLWYESKDKEWRLVCGLKLNGCDIKNLTMAECNGKLAFLWHKPEKMEIWCAMVALRRGVVNVQARLEWSNCLLSHVPPHYEIIHCFGGTD